jgi:hypothetical protein
MVRAVVSRSATAGFTLLEALIATVLGALVIGLVLSVVLAQGGYYGDVHARAGLQESVRSAADVLRDELHSVTRGGVLTARSDELVVRVPVAMGVVCGLVEGPPGKGKGKGKGKGPLSSAPVYLPLPGGGVDEGRISWYAVRGENGDWVYRQASWEELEGTGGNPWAECAGFGADWGGEKANFRRMTGFQPPAMPDAGYLVALFSEVEFRFQGSDLSPGRLALFRREGAGDPVEFVTGVTGESGFQYRRQDQTAFQEQVPPGPLSEIVEIRVRTEAESLDERGGAGPMAYEWDLRIPLRNVR